MAIFCLQIYFVYCFSEAIVLNVASVFSRVLVIILLIHQFQSQKVRRKYTFRIQHSPLASSVLSIYSSAINDVTQAQMLSSQLHMYTNSLLSLQTYYCIFYLYLSLPGPHGIPDQDWCALVGGCLNGGLCYNQCDGFWCECAHRETVDQIGKRCEQDADPKKSGYHDDGHHDY